MNLVHDAMQLPTQTNYQARSTETNTFRSEDKIHGRGKLYVIATPIGNLADFTFRALEILRQADWIICEDTRRTLKLLNHYGVQKPLLTIFGPKEKRETPKILHLLSQSKVIALLSDAGTPGISDPGNFLVRQAREQGFLIEAVPGVSAISCAVSISGCCEDGFIFLGFLHRRKKRIKMELLKVKNYGVPAIFFESPFRIVETLNLALEVMGEKTFCWIGREMTKKFEEHLSGDLIDVLHKIEQRKLLGELTVILKPLEEVR